jgi:hypothetical protein
MSMSLLKSIIGATTAAVVLTTVAAAGTMFRLEIGSTAALGMDKKFKDGPKKVVVAARAVVCEDLANVKISGTAEGVVNGKRESLPLTLMMIDRAEAVYAVGQQWPQDGTWLLHLKGSCSSPKADASTLVAVTRGTFIRDKSTVLVEPATKKQIDDALASLSRPRS